ncbi:hypothetical protein ACOME3_008530 [Neoechinorhynchus agilis]
MYGHHKSLIRPYQNCQAFSDFGRCEKGSECEFVHKYKGEDKRLVRRARSKIEIPTVETKDFIPLLESDFPDALDAGYESWIVPKDESELRIIPDFDIINAKKNAEHEQK